MPSPTLLGPPPKKGPYLKVSLYLRKLPYLTDEYFHAYWANNHVVPALANTGFRSKVRRYNQHHVTPELRESAKALGLPALDYDGVAEVWLDSLEDWKEIISDEHFKKQVASDEDNFLLKPINIQLGWDNLVIGDAWEPKGLN